ncbi:MAG: hypothetical protein ACRBBS_00650 [Thalassovita sp.]
MAVALCLFLRFERGNAAGVLLPHQLCSFKAQLFHKRRTLFLKLGRAGGLLWRWKGLCPIQNIRDRW